MSLESEGLCKEIGRQLSLIQHLVGHYANLTKQHERKFVTLSKEVLKSKVMRTLSISISDLEFNKFGIKTERLSFSDFVGLISQELQRQSLGRSTELAEKYGLSKLTMEDLSKEVEAVRKNAKNNS